MTSHKLFSRGSLLSSFHRAENWCTDVIRIRWRRRQPDPQLFTSRSKSFPRGMNRTPEPHSQSLLFNGCIPFSSQAGTAPLASQLLVSFPPRPHDSTPYCSVKCQLPWPYQFQNHRRWHYNKAVCLCILEHIRCNPSHTHFCSTPANIWEERQLFSLPPSVFLWSLLPHNITAWKEQGGSSALCLFSQRLGDSCVSRAVVSHMPLLQFKASFPGGWPATSQIETTHLIASTLISYISNLAHIGSLKEENYRESQRGSFLGGPVQQVVQGLLSFIIRWKPATSEGPGLQHSTEAPALCQLLGSGESMSFSRRHPQEERSLHTGLHVISLLGRADFGSQVTKQCMCDVLKMESFSPTQF